MSKYYISIDPKTLACVEVGLVNEERLVKAMSEWLILIPATRAGCRQAFGTVFESLEHAHREANKS